MRYYRIGYVYLFLLFGYIGVNAQISISNFSEFQYGKLPDESADFFPSIYDRAEIDYRKKGFSISSTIEQYHTSFDGRSYFDLSQLTLGYKKKKWDIKLGNFYETLGRGLLMRSFEIPGALLEDIGFRSRNYFHRDLLGASVKYRTKKATFQIIRADVLNNVLPPTFDRSERRTDLVTAVSSKVKYIKGQEAGVIFMRREQSNGQSQNYLSGLLNGSIVSGLDYYGEYATDLENGDYALYTGVSGYKGSFSFTTEYKKYNNFVLGAGINEPPAGVKQQTYRVLNRSIHVSNPTNEEGYQIDLLYNLKNGTILNFNHALAVNQFGSNSFSFREYFFEVQSSLNANIDYKAFIDYSQDPFKGENDRLSIGLYSDIGINEKIRFLPEVEYQSFDRGADGLYNFNLLLGLNVSSKYFYSILGELTNDPFIIKDGQSKRLYLGNTFRYKPNYKHTFQLFFGERRGGPQCSAGVCYEILDFKGVEVRWIGKFRG
ncbi:MAG: hypothetical protein ACJA01_003129 [Saprospiraceae bacterium]|jgi:hypothetical protein